MEITLSKNYEINNLISWSGRFSTMEFQQMVTNFINQYKDYAVNNGELVISTTKSVQIIDETQMVTVVGLAMGILGRKSKRKGMAIAGIIFPIATVVNAAFGAYFAMK